MIEHEEPETKRFAIYQAVHFAGMFAWDDNARSRNAGLIRILPPDRQKIGAKYIVALVPTRTAAAACQRRS